MHKNNNQIVSFQPQLTISYGNIAQFNNVLGGGERIGVIGGSKNFVDIDSERVVEGMFQIQLTEPTTWT